MRDCSEKMVSCFLNFYFYFCSLTTFLNIQITAKVMIATNETKEDGGRYVEVIDLINPEFGSLAARRAMEVKKIQQAGGPPT